MRIALWDHEIWDDPNLRWGSPSYVLEPGDAGYVPPPVSPTNKNKRKPMKRSSFYPRRAADQIPWLVNFGDKLPDHATAIGLSNAERDALIADAVWLVYVLQAWITAVRNWSVSCTNATIDAQSGSGAVAQVLPVFTPPALPGGVVPVLPGALDRIFTAIQLWRDGGKITDVIGSDLGLIGTEMTVDLDTLKPEFTAKKIATGLSLPWTFGGKSAFVDQIRLEVDRSDGHGFVFLNQDTTPGYIDTMPMPATPAKWTYRAIFYLNDAPVGLWSDPVSILVGG